MSCSAFVPRNGAIRLRTALTQGPCRFSPKHPANSWLADFLKQIVDEDFYGRRRRYFQKKICSGVTNSGSGQLTLYVKGVSRESLAIADFQLPISNCSIQISGDAIFSLIPIGNRQLAMPGPTLPQGGTYLITLPLEFCKRL
jgi:hypothetical protein